MYKRILLWDQQSGQSVWSVAKCRATQTCLSFNRFYYRLHFRLISFIATQVMAGTQKLESYTEGVTTCHRRESDHISVAII